jgi:hypothetical protein
VAPGEKRLLKKVGRYLPPGARVVAIEEANANPLDEQRRPTPVVMTEHGLVLVTSAGSTAVVTHVPFHRVSRTRSDGNVLGVDFLDEENRPRTFEADFGRAGPEFIAKFLHEVSQVRRDTQGDDDRVPVQSFHAAWAGGRGATFDVFDDKHIRPRYDHGVAGINAAELCKQAMMELAKAIAANPDLVWVRPQPEWMPELVWTPPLPQLPKGRE